MVLLRQKALWTICSSLPGLEHATSEVLSATTTSYAKEMLVSPIHTGYIQVGLGGMTVYTVQR